MPIGAIVGAGVVGAGASLVGSSMQAGAANKATATQKEMYQQTRKDLLPYNTAGQTATNMLMQQLPGLTSPIVMDKATLMQTPGYQFNRNQGLKAVQNSASARGLGISGAAQKGAGAYVTGLADNTYQNQFNNLLQSRQNTYNMLSGVADRGENAAAQTGSYGTQAAQNIGNSQIAAGNAAAAGIGGAGNALTNAANSYAGYKMFQGMYGAG